MILIFHTGNKVSGVELTAEQGSMKNSGFLGLTLPKVLTKLGAKFPEELLVWCREDLKDGINLREIPSLISNPLSLVTYRKSGDSFDFLMDYLDYSTSIKVQTDVRYPTWKMSSTVGVAYGKLFKEISISEFELQDGDFYLAALAKAYQPFGLMSYHEPKLLLPGSYPVSENHLGFSAAFRFARQVFSLQWAFFLFVALIIFEGKWKIFPFLRSLFSKKPTVDPKVLDKLRPRSPSIDPKKISLDVLIPTLGRESYVLQLLKDLAVQTIIPNKIIIVEQEREKGIGSQMPFLTEESWPFEIDHIFSVQRGPCYARNLGLGKVSSDWLFMADDDIRLENGLLESILSQMKSLNVEAATISCLLKDQVEENKYPHQTRIFGAGCSIVKSEIIQNVRFDEAYEFGYAEDSDFGAQIRNLGHDVIYVPSPTILHLKAPMGGFRAPVTFPWDNESPKPKPSPTVMLFWKRHFSPKQFQGNKLMLFSKFFAKRKISNPIQFVNDFKAKWNVSFEYTNKLDSGELKTNPVNA